MLNLPIFKKDHGDPNKFLALNINARDVKCLAFYYDNEVFKIIGSGNYELPEDSVRNGMVLDKDIVIDAINYSVEKATENSGDEIKNVIVGVDGGMTIGITTTVRMKRPNNDPIKTEELEELYSRIEDAASMQAHNKMHETTGDPDIELVSITTLDIYTKIDDQKVAVLEGQRGQTIEMAVFNSFSPIFHVNSLQATVKKAGLNIIALASQMYSLVEWLKEPPKEIMDFVLINLSEDSTDVGVIFGGGIISSKTLNIGYLHFLEAISIKMGLSKREAEGVLKMYSAEKLSESETPTIKNCLDEVLEIWVDGLKLLFEDFPGVKTFAPKVYLSGCGIDTKDIFETLKNSPWTKTIPFKDEPEFNKISFMDTKKMVNSTDHDLSTDWIYLASISKVYKEIMGI